MPKLNKSQIVKKIKAYVKEKNEVPTLRKFVDHYSFSNSMVYKNFDSFNEALKKAGYKVNTPRRNISKFCKSCLLKSNCVYDYDLENCVFAKEGWVNKSGGFNDD